METRREQIAPELYERRGNSKKKKKGAGLSYVKRPDKKRVLERKERGKAPIR